MGSKSYDGDNLKCESSRIIVDNAAAISMARCNKDTAGNRHVARRHHYVRQGTTLKEHIFDMLLKIINSCSITDHNGENMMAFEDFVNMSAN